MGEREGTCDATMETRQPDPIEMASTADGTELVLCSRDDWFQIRVDGRELMDSRHCVTERALARLALGYMAASEAPHVLVGGLGMGFTLREALDGLPQGSAVVVVEAVPAVVRWNRGPMASLSNDALSDPRVTVIEDDVFAVLAESAGSFDAVLLDVDNGPHDLALPGNERLYGEKGLRVVVRSLKPMGVVAIWSAERAPDLVERLLQMGICAWSETVWPLRDDARVAHTIVLAAREERTYPLA